VNTFYHFLQAITAVLFDLFSVSSGNFSKEKAGIHLGRIFVSKGGKPSLDEIEPLVRLSFF
jgi:hypothetical protein